MNKKRKVFYIILGLLCFFGFNNQVYAGTVKTFHIQNNEAKIKIGQTETFDTNFDMATGGSFEDELVWTVSDKSVAEITKVYSKGKKVDIKGLANGTVTVKACLKSDNEFCTSVALVVGDGTKPRVKSFYIENGVYEMDPGQTETIHVEVNMNGATQFQGKNNQTDMINWTSSDESVVLVTWKSENYADVTGVGPGEAMIKGCIGGQKEICATHKIKVTDGPKVSSEHENRITAIKIGNFQENIKVREKDTIQINYEWTQNPNEDKIKVEYVLEPNDGTITVIKSDKNTFEIVGMKQGNVKIKFCLSSRPDMCSEEKTITVSGAKEGYKENGESVAGNPGLSEDKDEFNMNHTNETYSCEGLIADDLENVIRWVMNIVRIAVPILLLVLCTVDFSQVILSGDQDAMKKATSKVIKRGLAALGFFLVPTVVNMAIGWIESDYFNSSDADCSEVLNSESGASDDDTDV